MAIDVQLEFISTLLSEEVLEKYIAAVDKLRKDLNLISLEDRVRSLRSCDQNGVGIMRLWCAKCNRVFGGSTSDHSKIAINNLFLNFNKSHVISNIHVQNWCKKKEISF